MILSFISYYLLTLSTTQGNTFNFSRKPCTKRKLFLALTIIQIELINGSVPNEGNLYVNGRPVCDHEWDNNDADVACRMLG